MDATSPPSEPNESPRQPLARRWWLNLGLLVVVAGLGLFAWYRSGHSPEEAKPALTDVKGDTVQAIEIERPKQPKVRLQRHGEGWRMAAPIDARADMFTINSLLSILKAPVEQAVTPGDANIARYGLDSPKVRIRFDATELDFGERHPLKDEQYVKYRASVQLIPSRYYAKTLLPYTSFIDSRLFEPNRKFVGFKLPDFSLDLKDGAWVRSPEIKTLSSDRINAFVDQWRHARALNVSPHSGAAKAQQSVTIRFAKPEGGETSLTVEVLAQKPELVLYRKDENLEYHFPEGTGDRLLKLNDDEKRKTKE